MPLNPPSNQFESLSVWLKDFNKTVATIIRGFSLEPYVTNQFQSVIPTEKGKSDASGIYTDGEYWLGFYYKLRNENRVALPWFGCEFVDKFNISIIIHETVHVAGTSNNALHRHLLLNEFPKKQLWVTQVNSNERSFLKCCFSDYMRIGYPNIRIGNPSFNLRDWMCLSTTQDADLKEFFSTINSANKPHV